MSATTLDALLEPLAAMQRLVERFADQGVIISGVATTLLGSPRLTADVDAMLLLSTDDVPALIEATALEGLIERIENAADFARQHRVLLLRHSASGIAVDISLGVLPFEQEVVERSQLHKAGSLTLRLPTPEDMIIFKAVAHRPKDLLDIQAIIAANPDLDRARIEYWVKQFAEVLELPELWEDVAGLLNLSEGG